MPTCCFQINSWWVDDTAAPESWDESGRDPFLNQIRELKPTKAELKGRPWEGNPK